MTVNRFGDSVANLTNTQLLEAAYQVATTFNMQENARVLAESRRAIAELARATTKNNMEQLIQDVQAMLAGGVLKGDTGDTGPQGIQGIQGIQGVPGITVGEAALINLEEVARQSAESDRAVLFEDWELLILDWTTLMGGYDTTMDGYATTMDGYDTILSGYQTTLDGYAGIGRTTETIKSAYDLAAGKATTGKAIAMAMVFG